jgi:hypothetical protein
MLLDNINPVWFKVRRKDTGQREKERENFNTRYMK